MTVDMTFRPEPLPMMLRELLIVILLFVVLFVALPVILVLFDGASGISVIFKELFPDRRIIGVNAAE